MNKKFKQEDTQNFFSFENTNSNSNLMATNKNNIAKRCRVNVDRFKAYSQSKVDIDGINVSFPYNPYQPQIDYMSSVIKALNTQTNALLQSPTGTGKTLSLLCSCLAWLDNYYSIHPREINLKSKLPQIIYSSRTHSQLKQVAKELKKTKYRPTMVTLGSKDKTCILSSIKFMKGGALRAACRKARVVKENCFYFKNTMKQQEKLIKNRQLQMLDIEDLNKAGQLNRFCPYYFQRAVQDKVQLVLMPYQYVVDPRIRELLEIDLSNSIIIFDEAHNIESTAEQGCSFTFSTEDLANCIQELQHLQKIKNERSKKGKIKLKNGDIIIKDSKSKRDRYKIKVSEENIRKVQAIIQNYKNWLSKIGQQQSFQQNKKTYSGKWIFEMLQKGTVKQQNTFFQSTPSQNPYLQMNQSGSNFENGLNPVCFNQYIEILKTCIDKLQLNEDGPHLGGLKKWQQFLEFCFTLWKEDRRINQMWSNNLQKNNGINFYQVYIEQRKDTQIQLNICCLSPHIAFQQLEAQKPRSIILTSGTLSPMSSFEFETKIPFPIKLECEHIISPTQLYSAIIKQGPSKNSFNFAYKNKNKLVCSLDLGNSIINLSSVIPNGMIVFFSSYRTMQNILKI